MVIVAGQVDEQRIVARRVEHGPAQRIEVRLGFDLPIVEIEEAFALMGHAAAARGVIVVVIAGVTELAGRLDE